MNESEQGVILFSLGTNIKSHSLPPEMKESFVTAFSKLNETIIWKYGIDEENLSKNILTRKWLPQNDILGSTNKMSSIHLK